MAREEDKHRASEYVPVGPIQIAERGALIDALKRIAVLEAQVASLQVAMPKGITLHGWHCACGIFNSSEKEELKECRSCGLARP